MKNNLHQDGCSTFGSCTRHDLCCPRWRRHRPGKEYVGAWRGNCLNICGTVCCGHAGVCVCSVGYKIQSFTLTCLYGKNQSTRFVIELITASLVAQLIRPRFDSWVRKIPWRRDRLPTPAFLGFPGGSAGKESTCNAGDLALIPGLGRSPGEGKGYPLQYSGLQNSMDWIVHGVTKSWTRLINLHFHFHHSKWWLSFNSKPLTHNPSSYRSFPAGSVVKNLPANAGGIGLIPGSERFHGEGNGNSLQYSCSENPIDKGAWWVVVRSVAKSWTRLSMHARKFHSTCKCKIVLNFMILAVFLALLLSNAMKQSFLIPWLGLGSFSQRSVHRAKAFLIWVNMNVLFSGLETGVPFTCLATIKTW